MTAIDDGLPRFGDLDDATIDSLQIVLDELHLRRRPKGGILLDIVATPDTPCVRSNDDRRQLHPRIDLDDGGRVRDHVDAFRRGEGGDEFRLPLAEFRLRHGSAGVLPIVRQSGADRVMLYYRDIHPVGWNIANGGAASVDELAGIDEVMLREFAEEVLFCDPERGRFAVPHVESQAAATAHKPSMRPEAAWARRFGWFDDRPAHLAVAWASGPDAVRITLPDRTPVLTPGLFVSINVDDFGIECSRLARIEVPGGLVPLDGELLADDELLDRAVGLFDPKTLSDETPRPTNTLASGVPVETTPEAALCPVAHDLAARLIVD